jgi:hypothetical protein
VGLNDIYPVQTKPASEALILPQPEAGVPSGWALSSVLAAADVGLIPGLVIRAGTGSFLGNGTALVEAPTLISLAGAVPIYCDFSPTFTSAGGAWAAQRGQYAVPTPGEAFFLATLGSGVFTNGVKFFFQWIAFGALVP